MSRFLAASPLTRKHSDARTAPSWTARRPWAPSPGRPTVAKASLILALLLVAWCGSAAENVVISEFMASNKDTLRDGNGNASDWIELYNAGGTAVDLAGWHLTEDPLRLAQWTFPSVTLGPGQFLLVFASGSGVPDPA